MYHLLDHGYGQTPQNQIIRIPSRSEANVSKFEHLDKNLVAAVECLKCFSCISISFKFLLAVKNIFLMFYGIAQLVKRRLNLDGSISILPSSEFKTPNVTTPGSAKRMRTNSTSSVASVSQASSPSPTGKGKKCGKTE